MLTSYPSKIVVNITEGEKATRFGRLTFIPNFSVHSAYTSNIPASSEFTPIEVPIVGIFLLVCYAYSCQPDGASCNNAPALVMPARTHLHVCIIASVDDLHPSIHHTCVNIIDPVFTKTKYHCSFILITVITDTYLT